MWCVWLRAGALGGEVGLGWRGGGGSCAVSGLHSASVPRDVATSYVGYRLHTFVFKRFVKSRVKSRVKFFVVSAPQRGRSTMAGGRLLVGTRLSNDAVVHVFRMTAIRGSLRASEEVFNRYEPL